RLEDVAVEPQRPLTERLEVGDGTDRTADQPLDLDGPAFLAPRARLALRTRARRGRQERVLGGHPPYSLPGQPPRNPLLDRRRAQNPGRALRVQHDAVRLL